MPTGNFSSLLTEMAREHKDAVALVVPQGKLSARTWQETTFGALEHMVDGYTRGLADKGVRRGDRVLFLVKPSTQFYALFFAIVRLGAVPVLIDPGMGIPGVLKCIEQIKPRVVVGIPIIQAVRVFKPGPFRSSELNVTVGSRWFWGGETAESCFLPSEDPFPAQPCQPGDEAIIAFTSGSTGPAKGVVFTHGMFARQAQLLKEVYGWKPGDTMVMCFAAFVLFTLAHGVTTVIPDMNLSKPGSVNPACIVEAVNDRKANLAFASPIVWMKVTRHAEPLGVKLPTLRQVTTTGAPIQANLHERMRRILPEGAELHTPYGATEALPLTTMATNEILADTADEARQGGGICVGRPFPGVRVELIKVTDEPIESWSDDLRVAPGEVGEIVAGGDVVSPEYKERPDANRSAKITENGAILHRMGDLGRLDDKGRLWFCGRKAHRLQTAGGMVPCVPVEMVFNEHPQVFRSALVGVGERGREAPVLCLHLEEGAAFSEAMKGEVLALGEKTRWKGLVKHVLVHPGFPTDPRHNTKIIREKLKVWAADQLKLA
jgi:acyl-coenzyme A synthetase/AMP-(fatty) acid ligase